MRHGSAKRKRSVLCVFFAVLLCALLGGFLLLRGLPVSWDACACGGGYAMFVFDKYSGDLVEKLRRGLNDADEACSIQAVRGTQTAKWNGRKILLQFDVTYQHGESGSITKSVLFTGHRVWFDTYDWNEPVIHIED